MVKLGIVGGSSLVTFDPKDAFSEIGLEMKSTTSKTVTNQYGKVDLKIISLKGSNTMHTLIFMQR